MSSPSKGEDWREGGTVPPIVHEVLRSPGQPLDDATRAFMEPRFGHDFSQVRVHTDANAAESARAVSARAYVVGQHIAFASGEYAPATEKGRPLLIHELVHTVQQGSRSHPDETPLPIGREDDPKERQATRFDAIGAGGIEIRPILRRQADDAPSEGNGPGHRGELQDAIDQIRREREARYAKLAQRYREGIQKAAGLPIGGSIAGPDAARRALEALGVDLKELTEYVSRIKAATTGALKGQITSESVEDLAAEARANLSEKGRHTLATAIAGLRRERWFANALDSGNYILLPDPAACARYGGYTQYGSFPVSGAKQARQMVAIVHLCRSSIEAGDREKLESLLVHELSHGLEKEFAGEATATLVTHPVLAEIAQQVAQAPEFSGQENEIRQYLFEKLGGYPQSEIFAVLQQLPQDAALRKGDLLLAILVCELRRLDAARLPNDIRVTLIDDLKLRTAFFYDERIRESQGGQAASLKLAKRLALQNLDLALSVRSLEQLGESPYEIKCTL